MTCKWFRYLCFFFYAAVFLMTLFDAAVSKSSLLMQGLMEIFLKVTVSLGNNKIKNERSSKDDTEMVPLWLLLFDDSDYVFCFYSGVSPNFLQLLGLKNEPSWRPVSSQET